MAPNPILYSIPLVPSDSVLSQPIPSASRRLHELGLLCAPNGVRVASVRAHERDPGGRTGRVKVFKRHVLRQDASHLSIPQFGNKGKGDDKEGRGGGGTAAVNAWSTEPKTIQDVGQIDHRSPLNDLDLPGEDLYGVAHVAGWETYHLHDLKLFPGLDLHFTCTDSALHLLTADL